MKRRWSFQDPKYLMYSGLEIAYWFGAATAVYTTVYLQGMGYTPTQVGFISAANSIAGIIAMPFWGMMCDRFRSVRKIFILCMLLSAVTVPLVPIIGDGKLWGLALPYLTIPFTCLFRNPVMSLTDTWVIQAANKERLNYGSMRLWGSLSFAVMAFFLAWVMPIVGLQYSFYFYAIAALIAVVVGLRIKEDAVNKKEKPLKMRELNVGRLFTDYFYVSYLIFAVVSAMPQQTSFVFLPYLIEKAGASSTMIGVISGLKACIEVPFLLTVGTMRTRFKIQHIIITAGIFSVLGTILLGFSSSLGYIIFVSVLQGVGQGLSIGSTSNYVYNLAPDNLKATAQTLNGSMVGVSAIIGNLLGGWLVELIGINAYYGFAGGIMGVALLYFAMSFKIGTKILKKPLPMAAMDPREMLRAE